MKLHVPHEVRPGSHGSAAGVWEDGNPGDSKGGQSPLYPRCDPQVLTPEDRNGLSRLKLEISQSPCSRRNTHHFAAVAELLLIFIEKAEHNASEETQLPQFFRRWL